MIFKCHCGAVVITAKSKPSFAHACNCTLCTKADARWAYFEPSHVTIEGLTSGYRRADKVDPGVEVHACCQCAVTTHFVLTDSVVARHGDTTVGVNINLADPDKIKGIELRFPDGRSWDGTGAFGYYSKPKIL